MASGDPGLYKNYGNSPIDQELHSDNRGSLTPYKYPKESSQANCSNHKDASHPNVPKSALSSTQYVPMRQSPSSHYSPRREFYSVLTGIFAKHGIYLQNSEKLGSGRYSKVITANTRSGYTIAIKMIKKSDVSVEFRKKFLPREIDNWRQLDHPFIVRLLQCNETMGHIFLFMEYANGGDLLKYVQTNGAVPEIQVQKWMFEICTAVRYMHARNIAHRDLKLENIVIFNNHVKLADFGFSRQISDHDLSQTYCGSKAYSAPEVLQGVPYDPKKADIWSLGVVAFVMITDSMPFQDKASNPIIIDNQRKHNFIYPAQLAISDSARSVIRRLLAFEINDRPHIHDVLMYSWIVTGGCPGVIPRHPNLINERHVTISAVYDEGLRDSNQVQPNNQIQHGGLRTHQQHMFYGGIITDDDANFFTEDASNDNDHRSFPAAQ